MLLPPKNTLATGILTYLARLENTIEQKLLGKTGAKFRTQSTAKKLAAKKLDPLPVGPG